MAKRHGANKIGRNGGIGRLMLAFVSFVFGYLIAIVFDFNQLSSWVSTKFFSKNSSQQLVSKTDAQIKKELPKPKLEFYTLLSQDSSSLNKQKSGNHPTLLAKPKESATVNLSLTKDLPLHEPLARKTNDLKVAVSSNLTEKYLLQVGSFKFRNEAEKMRVQLVMKGFDASVVEANHQGVNWYRVVIGPFASKVEAQKLQMSIVKTEHINGMIRKADV